MQKACSALKFRLRVLMLSYQKYMMSDHQLAWVRLEGSHCLESKLTCNFAGVQVLLEEGVDRMQSLQ